MSKPIPNYFILNRSLLNSTRWLCEKFTKGQAWVDLVGLAQHTDGFIEVRGTRIEVRRGWLAYSQRTLSERWKWSRQKTKAYLEALRGACDIEIEENHATGKWLIHIVKYDFWQGNITTDLTTDQTTERTTDFTYTNNDKNNKNEKKTSVVVASNAPTPAQEARLFFDTDETKNETIRKLVASGHDEDFIRVELRKFCSYWTERNKTGTKQRWELEKSFEVRRRLVTWLNRASTPFPRPR